MRILYYNWADYLDPEKQGGGVSVYQRNLIRGLAGVPGIETAFLSSGLAHDLRRSAPYVIEQENGASPRYALVNSGLVAPSHADFAGAAQLEHAATEQVFADFVERTGPWDVIHFNNLEGLPATVLSLKERWPQTRFVLSLHNYYPFCPQVNLWFDERETCTDYDGGTKCTRCLAARPRTRSVRFAYAMGWRLSRAGLGPGSAVFDRLFRPGLAWAWRQVKRGLTRRHRRSAEAPAASAPLPALAPVEAPPPAAESTMATINLPAEAFARRRARMVGLINAHCDAVLCVSERVRQIALHHGIHASRLSTLYIGTAEAAEWHRTRPREQLLRDDGSTHLAYLGYMRRDKGFHFLMRALRALPQDQAKRLHLTIAAKNGEPEAMAALDALKPHLASVRHVRGYSHAELGSLLAEVDVGLVPVMWEDNLPQVAIEMHARHIPLITSDRGGAQELGRCNALVFRAGSTEDFHRVLDRILAGSVTTAQYWAQAVAPVSVAEHIDALLARYRSLS